jgi:hypothetical protein
MEDLIQNKKKIKKFSIQMIRVKKFLCLIASYEWQLYAVKQLATVIYLDQGPLLSDDGMLVRNFSDDKIKS